MNQNAPITRSRTQGGRGQRAGPFRSRPDEEPDGVNCGASGAVPRDGTVSPNSETSNGEGTSSLVGINARPAGAPTRRDGRMRWSEEENILIMRIHFVAKELQQSTGRTYREILTTTWNDINPEKQLYPNLLSNRVRWILQNEKFSVVELNAIQQSTRPYAPVMEHDDERIEISQPITNTNEGRNTRQNKIERIFNKNMQMYMGISPQERPRVPRLKGSQYIIKSVHKVNEVLRNRMSEESTLEEIIDYVYIGAITVCEDNNVQLKSVKRTPSRETIPPWKKRLETKITTIRKKIGVLCTYLQSNSPSRKLLRSVHRIASELHIKSRHVDFQHKLEVACDTLKQKAKALGNRIQRYNDRVKRYKNNQLYYKNTKQFFRSLENTMTKEEKTPTAKEMHTAWKEIWGHEEMHDDTAFWIRDAERNAGKYAMKEMRVTEDDITTTIKKTNNWSAPGPDGIHNYWWKYFSSTHGFLAGIFQKALADPSIIPDSITVGITHMIPKGNTNGNPKNYRPITCLSAIYKILTGILTLHIARHVGKHSILAREQGGCRRDARGCKELLVIDSLITKQAKRRQRNISMAWIDYKKAFDSIPHSWLLKTLQLYGVSKDVITLLAHLMKSWRTRLLVNNQQGTDITEELNIKKGLFQGDNLSTLWFCLAINFLSKLLNDSNYGYNIENTNKTKITHQLYVDDLKLFAAGEDQLTRLLKIVAYFTKTIRMEMGLDKCAILHVKRGKIVSGEHVLAQDEVTIQTLNPGETYKYLGIQQGLDINTTEAKTTFKNKFLTRIKKVLQSKLNARAMFTSINTWAMPVLTYSFGVIKWSPTDLKAIDIQVRALLTKHGIHHPRASVNRLYIPRNDGGRGLQNIETAHYKAVTEMRQYFLKKNTTFFKTLFKVDENITPLNLASTNQPAEPSTITSLSEEWHGKALHGRYPTALRRNTFNKEKSVSYLKAGYLFPETEGRLAAIQDQVVPTRAYLKNIVGKNIFTDKCRKCSRATETVQHVTSSCPVLAPREYTDRHNAMAKVYHQAIAIKTGLIKSFKKIHEYSPQELLENDELKLYWDSPLITDRSIPHNRPDIVIFEKAGNRATIIDVTIPADDNAERAYTEKITKYHDLAFELKEIYKLTSTSIIPLIITTNGLVEKHLVENTNRLGLEERLISDAQREVILWTTRIIRGFLTSE